MPLSLSTEEMDLLLSLAVPIEQHLRTERLTAVATAELEGQRAEKPARSGSGSTVHRTARAVPAALFRPAADLTQRDSARCTAAAPPDGAEARA